MAPTSWKVMLLNCGKRRVEALMAEEKMGRPSARKPVGLMRFRLRRYVSSRAPVLTYPTLRTSLLESWREIWMLELMAYALRKLGVTAVMSLEAGTVPGVSAITLGNCGANGELEEMAAE